jgi:hypothetical protein
MDPIDPHAQECLPTEAKSQARMEQVQEIGAVDALNEGSPRIAGLNPQVWFSNMWNSIYNTWDENPWVWCCEFEVVK